MNDPTFDEVLNRLEAGDFLFGGDIETERPFPDRPALDKLVEDAGLGLKPDQTGTVYVAPPAPGLASSTSLHRFETSLLPGASPNFSPPLVELPREMEEAIEFERRLQAAYHVPSYLVLATEPRLKYLEIARQNLAKHFPMAILDCEREMLAALRKESETKRVRWEIILRADAASPGNNESGSREWCYAAG